MEQAWWPEFCCTAGQYEVFAYDLVIYMPYYEIIVMYTLWQPFLENTGFQRLTAQSYPSPVQNMQWLSLLGMLWAAGDQIVQKR